MGKKLRSDKRISSVLIYIFTATILLFIQTPSMTEKTIDYSAKPATGYTFSVFIVGALFFIFGFVTWLNGSLIPYLRIACELNNFESYLVAFAFYISYFVMAIPSSWVLKKTGFKRGMMAGLLVMAL